LIQDARVQVSIYGAAIIQHWKIRFAVSYIVLSAEGGIPAPML
jgi:hypothetical protein